jgi:hypothetical protein
LSEFSGKPMEKPWISPAKKNRQLGHWQLHRIFSIAFSTCEIALEV